MTDLNISWNSPRNNCHYWKWTTFCSCSFEFGWLWFLVLLENHKPSFLFITLNKRLIDSHLCTGGAVQKTATLNDSYSLIGIIQGSCPAEALNHHFPKAPWPCHVPSQHHFCIFRWIASGPFAWGAMPRTSETMKFDVLKLFVTVFDAN